MLSSRHLMRIVSMMRWFAVLANLADWTEIDDLCRRCESEARVRAQEEMIEEPDWMKGAPWNDFE